MKPLWLIKLEEHQERHGLTNYALDRAFHRIPSGIVGKAKRRAMSGSPHSISMAFIYRLATLMRCSPRELIETKSPFAVRTRIEE